MKNITTILPVGFALLIAACATSPTPEEMAAGQRAMRPTSQEAAEAAVIKYFGATLKDPESARYTFRAPTNGYLVVGSARQFGWFMCGTVNAKNSYSGYVGASPFLVLFRSAQPRSRCRRQ